MDAWVSGRVELLFLPLFTPSLLIFRLLLFFPFLPSFLIFCLLILLFSFSSICRMRAEMMEGGGRGVG